MNTRADRPNRKPVVLSVHRVPDAMTGRPAKRLHATLVGVSVWARRDAEKARKPGRTKGIRDGGARFRLTGTFGTAASMFAGAVAALCLPRRTATAA